MNFRTPLLSDISDKSNAIYLKCEHTLPGGSYKARGVEVFLASLPHHTQKIRVLSAGNMARTVAMLARERGFVVEAMVPESIPEVKRRRLEELGVELLPVPFSVLWEEVDVPRVNGEIPLLHPVDSPKLIEGYGNIALEVLAQAEISEVVIPFGVGGLTLGMSQVIRQVAPQVRVIVAENEAAAPLFHGFCNPRAEVTRLPSWIDAIGTPYSLPRVRERLLASTPLVDEIRVVSPEAAFSAGRDLYQRQGELIEGAAAVALAAGRRMESGRVEVSNRPRRNGRTVVILTGRNIDPERYGLLFVKSKRRPYFCYR